MSAVKRYAEEFIEFYNACKELEKKVPQEFGWKLNEVFSSYNSMFDRFCPFKVGDRVELAKTPIIGEDSAPGWVGCKHFLIAGAKGVVRERGYCEDHFVFDVEFDNESWIDKEGKIAPVTLKHVFRFSEKMLQLESDRT